MGSNGDYKGAASLSKLTPARSKIGNTAKYQVYEKEYLLKSNTAKKNRLKLGLAMRRFLLMRIDAHQMRIDAHIPHH